MSLPCLVVTGASGFVGRHLLDALKEDYRIVGLARRSQARSGAPVHPNITLAPGGHRRPGGESSRSSRESGTTAGPTSSIHLAAHYDFTGEEHPEYERTNVQGLRNVLELARPLGLKRFIFSSSTAACRFPATGEALVEGSLPDGDHIYARTKAKGERMLGGVPRLLPLHDRPLRRALLRLVRVPAAVHVPRDLAVERLERADARRAGAVGDPVPPRATTSPCSSSRCSTGSTRCAPGQVLQASPDGAVSHQQLYDEATLLHFGNRRASLHMPRPLCGPGMWGLDLLGRLIGKRPFERPWMARYIDLAMTIDASRTRSILGWEPRPRLQVLRRLPFLLENRKTDPIEWNRANRAAMKEVHLETNLRIFALLKKHAHEIALEYTEVLTGPEGRERFPSYQQVSEQDHRWNHTLILRHLMNAVRTRERSILVSYCRDLAERRFQQGFQTREVCDALRELNRIVYKRLLRDPEAAGMKADLYEHVTMTLTWGCDEAQQVFEHLEARCRKSRRRGRTARRRRPAARPRRVAKPPRIAISPKSNEPME